MRLHLMSERRARIVVADLFLKAAATVPMIGLAFLAALLLLAFEEVSPGHLAVAAGSLLVPPLVAAVHLRVTRTLPEDARGRWLVELRKPSRAATAAMSYLLDGESRNKGPSSTASDGQDVRA